MDFDDLLFNTDKLFKSTSMCSTNTSTAFHYLLVDDSRNQPLPILHHPEAGGRPDRTSAWEATTPKPSMPFAARIRNILNFEKIIPTCALSS